MGWRLPVKDPFDTSQQIQAYAHVGPLGHWDWQKGTGEVYVRLWRNQVARDADSANLGVLRIPFALQETVNSFGILEIGSFQAIDPANMHASFYKYLEDKLLALNGQLVNVSERVDIIEDEHRIRNEQPEEEEVLPE